MRKKMQEVGGAGYLSALHELSGLIAVAVSRLSKAQSSEQPATQSDFELPKAIQQSGYGATRTQNVTL